jgi:hypothetical protein
MSARTNAHDMLPGTLVRLVMRGGFARRLDEAAAQMIALKDNWRYPVFGKCRRPSPTYSRTIKAGGLFAHSHVCAIRHTNRGRSSSRYRNGKMKPDVTTA